MVHRFRLREIAAQSGLSEATVDRVLHERPGVRIGTQEQVREAIADLERQRSQLRIGARTFFVDVVVQAPERFTTEVRDAVEHQLGVLRPAVVRSRFHLTEEPDAEAVASVLDRIAAKGPRTSHGVLLKAPDLPMVVEAVDRVVSAGIPVVTLVTDLPSSARIAYVGMDNRAAGATAAYLMSQWLGERRGSVLMTLSSNYFRGEEEREMGFRATMRELQPGRELIEVSEGGGLDRRQQELVQAALVATPDVEGVYSIGGANRATLMALEAAGVRPTCFIAHDLDGDNRPLLQSGRLSAVLHHDLGSDLRAAVQVILQVGNAIPEAPVPARSAVLIATPLNLPH